MVISFTVACILLILLQISNALKQFGSSDQDTSIIVAVIDDCQGDEKAEEVFSRVEGTRVPLSRLSQVCDSAAAKKVDRWRHMVSSCTLLEF